MTLSAAFQAGAFQLSFQLTGQVVQPGPTCIVFEPTITNNTVTELSDYFATISFLDINRDPYTPTAAQWRCYDLTNKVQLQDWTNLLLQPVITLDIPAALNALGNPKSLMEWRMISLKVTAPGGAVRYDEAYYAVIAIPDIP